MYVGCVWQEYAAALERLAVSPSVAVLTGSGLNFMVGRVSYTFGLQGALLLQDDSCLCFLAAFLDHATIHILRLYAA